MQQEMNEWARGALGLAQGAKLEHVCALGAGPRPPVAQALALSPPRAGSSLAELVSKHADWTRLSPAAPDAAEAMRRAGVVVKACAFHGVVAFEARDAALRWAGNVVERAPGELLIDARTVPAGVHVVTRGCELVFRVSRDKTLVGIVRRTLTIPAIEGSRPPEAPDAPIDEWLADVAAAEWLTTAARAFATSPSPTDRLVAAGLVARLWTPLDPSDARRLGNPLAPSPGPVDRVLSWAASLPGPLLEFAEASALGRLDNLRDALDAIADDAAASLIDREARSVAACLARDDLACIETILRIRDRSAALTLALDALDARVHELGSRLPAPLDVDDARLLEVAATEPDAWWAAP